MNDEEIINFLNSIDQAEEASSVRTFDVYIDRMNVTVNIYDQGTRAGGNRFMVEAYRKGTEDERQIGATDYTLGNAEATLREALHGPHWYQFRRDN